MLSHLIDPLTSLLYPQFCGACGQLVEKMSDGAVCGACWSLARMFGPSDLLCAKCGAFLVESHITTDVFCGRCTDHFYDRARAVGHYTGALSAAVLHLKRVPHISGAVARLITAAADRFSLPEPFVVMPVPLSKRRFTERGFNQAALLAKAVSRHTVQTFDQHTLVRKHDTPMHRAAMDRKAREATVKNVFEVVRPNLVAGKVILLIDDLMTSGSTVSQCAKVLKKSGAAKVYVLTLARAV